MLNLLGDQSQRKLTAYSSRRSPQWLVHHSPLGHHGSRFTEAVDISQAKIRQRRADSTQDADAFWLGNVVQPQLGELRFVECDVANIDAFFSRLELERSVIEKRGRLDDGNSLTRPTAGARPAPSSPGCSSRLCSTSPSRRTRCASWSDHQKTRYQDGRAGGPAG